MHLIKIQTSAALPSSVQTPGFYFSVLTDIYYIKGSANCTADTLSRIEAETKCQFDGDSLALAQENDQQLQALREENKYKFIHIPTPDSNRGLWYQTTGQHRLYVPQVLRRPTIWRIPV